MKKSFATMAALTVWAFAFAQIAPAALTNRYVIKDNAGSAVPYDSQVNAASNIQLAIDYAKASETVLVYAATYDAGGITNWPAGTILTNRVVINKAITVMSVSNDPANTIIKGAWDQGTTNGPAAVRCVYLSTHSSKLIGFTLTNGGTLSASSDVNDRNGAGILAAGSSYAIVSNCVIAGNWAKNQGGGAVIGGNSSGVTLYNCTLAGNHAGYYAALQGSGNPMHGTAIDCTIVGNWADGTCAGAYWCILYNCLIAGNQSGQWSPGAGANSCALYNCTIIGNSTGPAGTSAGGGTAGGTLYNCIIYSNNGTAGTENYSGSALTNCCTTPTNSAWVAGDGNITNNPMFVANGRGYGTNHVAGNYRLSGSSLCINAGTNGAWTTNSTGWVDLDGRPRVRYGRADIGCYEYVSKGAIISVR